MSQRKHRVGIIGCGKIAINHAAALQRIPEVELVACTDVDGERAAAFAADHGIARSYGDVGKMLTSGLDAVTVCTPHPVHEAGVLAAARHGLHVLCEKPIAITLEETDRMIDACRDAEVKFGVLFQRRFWPAAQRIRQALDDGTLGTPIIGTCAVRLGRDADYYAEPWRGRWDTEGGGVMINQGIHYLDLLQWFMGDCVSVSARIATLKHGDHMETEDACVAILEFASGGLATLTASVTFAPGLGNQVLISDTFGQTASLTEMPEGTCVGNDIWTVGGCEEYLLPYSVGIDNDPSLATIHQGLVPFHREQIQEFIQAVLDDREPAVSGTDARKSLAVIIAIYESARTGRPVAVSQLPAVIS